MPRKKKAMAETQSNSVDVDSHTPVDEKLSEVSSDKGGRRLSEGRGDSAAGGKSENGKVHGHDNGAPHCEKVPSNSSSGIEKAATNGHVEKIPSKRSNDSRHSNPSQPKHGQEHHDHVEKIPSKRSNDSRPSSHSQPKHGQEHGDHVKRALSKGSIDSRPSSHGEESVKPTPSQGSSSHVDKPATHRGSDHLPAVHEDRPHTADELASHSSAGHGTAHSNVPSGTILTAHSNVAHSLGYREVDMRSPAPSKEPSIAPALSKEPSLVSLQSKHSKNSVSLPQDMRGPDSKSLPLTKLFFSRGKKEPPVVKEHRASKGLISDVVHAVEHALHLDGHPGDTPEEEEVPVETYSDEPTTKLHVYEQPFWLTCRLGRAARVKNESSKRPADIVDKGTYCCMVKLPWLSEKPNERHMCCFCFTRKFPRAILPWD